MKARALVGVIIICAAASLLLVGSKEVVSVVEPEHAYSLTGFNSPVLRELSAEGVMIQRGESKEVLFEKRASDTFPIASITKLFLAHIVHDSDRAEEVLSITWGDLNTEGEAGGLRYGEEYSMRELLFPLLLASSNDAGTALVRAFGSEQYRASLTDLMGEMFLRDTTIIDGSGLSADNRSTARDLAAFLSYLSTNDPHILDITALSSYVGEYHSWQNNNPMAGRSSFRGGKNGYTEAAGRTFAGILKDSEGKEYIVVLLASDALPRDLELIEEALP